MYGRILVPVDGSPISEAGWSVACDLAERVRGQLFLLEVVETLRPARLAPIIELSLGPRWVEVVSAAATHERNAHRYLTQLLEEAPTVDAEALVRAGDPVRQILSVAAEVGADLIVMSTHGRSGLARMLVGSVAEEVLRTAPVPVMLVGPRAGSAREAYASAGVGA